MEHTSEYQRLHRLLHTLWGKAARAADYDKSEWSALDALLNAHFFNPLPCGHSSQYFYTETGGKHLCLLCEHESAASILGGQR
jgi:hypothetical protein